MSSGPFNTALNHGKGRSLPYGKGKGFDKGKGYGKGAKNTSPAMPPLPAGFESVRGIPAKGAEANAVQGMQALPVRSSAAPRMPAASAAKNGIAGTQPPPPMNKAPAMPAQPADGVQPVPAQRALAKWNQSWQVSRGHHLAKSPVVDAQAQNAAGCTAKAQAQDAAYMNENNAAYSPPLQNVWQGNITMGRTRQTHKVLR